MHGELLKNEVELKEDECCIIFDFGCYFPYANMDDLVFDFSLENQIFNDKKLNHRYPNKGYQTISRRYGKKVSRIGYPYIMNLNKQDLLSLVVKVGIYDKIKILNFSIKTNMTKERPACALTMHYMFDKGDIRFISHVPDCDGGWQQYNWVNYNPNNVSRKNCFMLTPEKNNLIYMTGKQFDIYSYREVITPHASDFDKLMI